MESSDRSVQLKVSSKRRNSRKARPRTWLVDQEEQRAFDVRARKRSGVPRENKKAVRKNGLKSRRDGNGRSRSTLENWLGRVYEVLTERWPSKVHSPRGRGSYLERRSDSRFPAERGNAFSHGEAKFPAGRRTACATKVVPVTARKAEGREWLVIRRATLFLPQDVTTRG